MKTGSGRQIDEMYQIIIQIAPMQTIFYRQTIRIYFFVCEIIRQSYNFTQWVIFFVGESLFRSYFHLPSMRVKIRWASLRLFIEYVFKTNIKKKFNYQVILLFSSSIYHCIFSYLLLKFIINHCNTLYFITAIFFYSDPYCMLGIRPGLASAIIQVYLVQQFK